MDVVGYKGSKEQVPRFLNFFVTGWIMVRFIQTGNVEREQVFDEKVDSA